jgi:hypothetical protein
MRLATLASLLVASLAWFALSTAPAEVSADEKATTCQTCGQSTGSCPHCAAGKDCPHCKGAQACPHCKAGEACPHCAKAKHCGHCGHPGKWGAHEWDYKCVRPPKKPAEMTKQFKALGADGWRLIEAQDGIWCFSKMKRG